MYVFEFTDEKIIIYNQKNHALITYQLPSNIIKDNKIYDFVYLQRILYRIVNKYKLVNTLFRIVIKIVIFEELSPSDIYLFKNLFKNISNIKTEIIHVNKYFPNNYIFASGNNLYINNKKVYKFKDKDYVIVGFIDDLACLKRRLIAKYHINLLEVENSNTIIYEKI